MRNVSIKDELEKAKRSKLVAVLFYATKYPDYRNKLFSFKVDNIHEAGRLVYRFWKSGNEIRSTFLKNVDTKTGEIYTVQYDKQFLLDAFYLFLNISKNRSL
jgi:hypothetical protein